MSFDSFNLHSLLQQHVIAQGYTEPTPIQAQSIPAVMGGRDIIGLAPTGTGKTAAFVLPMLHQLLSGEVPRSGKQVRGLIIVPTRELAEQVHQVVKTFSAKTPIRSTTVYGGVSMNNQIHALRRGVDIVIACPGRLLDHIRRRTVDLRAVNLLVLDEADQMFDMGFLPNIRAIIQTLPKNRQNILYSATMPANIKKLAEDILVDPLLVQVAKLRPAETVSQSLLPVHASQKTPLLLKLLSGIPKEESVLVFTRTKHRANQIGVKLVEAGYNATSLQGNLSQAKRQVAMSGFRSGKYQIMVATDIAARGIDVSQIFHVVNYDMPQTVEAYTHRIGRTGRASRTGTAYTFVTSEDHGDVRATERELQITIPRKKLEGFEYHAVSEGGSDRAERRPYGDRRPHHSRHGGGGRSQQRRNGNGGGGGFRDRNHGQRRSRSY